MTTDVDHTTPRATTRERVKGLNTDTIAFVGFFFGSLALVVSLFAVALAGRAVMQSDDHGGDAQGSGSGGSTSVVLTEFAIAPGDLSIAAGAVVQVQNDGSGVHNLSVDGSATPMLDAGGGAELDLSGLAPGTYTMRCEVPGHEAAGMKGTLTVS